jgi:hypothetical protein
MGNEQVSALNLLYVACVPLAVWLVLRRLEGSLTAKRFAAWCAVVLTGQFLISPEVLATSTVFGGAALIGAFAALPDARPRLRALAAPLLSAYGLLAVLVSPLLYAMFARPHLSPAFGSTSAFSNDLLSLLVPSPPLAIGARQFAGLTANFPGGPLPAQRGFGYLGIPLLLVVAIALVPARGRITASRAIRVAGAIIIAAAIASLGPELHVAGHKIVPLPWALVDRLPLLRYATPSRFALFTALGAGVVLAIWLAARPSAARWALAGVSLLFLLPDPGRFGRSLYEPTAYRDGRITRVLHHDDAVLALPPYGASMRWQAETRMAYRLAGGYVGAFPWDYLAMYCELADASTKPQILQRFLRDHGVTAVLAAPGFDALMRRLVPSGGRVSRVGDQTIVRLAPSGTPAPQVGMSTRGGAFGDCARATAGALAR